MSLVAEADFGLSLLTEASLNQTTVISPISIALALSLVHLGAKGNSKEQIKDALCGSSNDADCSSHFSSLQKSLAQKGHPYLKDWVYCSKPGNISCVPKEMREYYKPEEVPADFPLQHTDVLMNIANRVFAANEVKIKKTYQDELAAKFDAKLQNIDYSNPGKAAEIVNDYVKKETVGKIEKLVDKDGFQNNKLALLVNAVYFHGRWETSFGDYNNEQKKFYEKEGDGKEVTFMKHVEERFPIVANSHFRALGLPFKDPKYRLTILLPQERFGLAAALKKMSGHDLKTLITNEHTKFVNVHLPKFKIDAQMQLAEVLQKVGITDPFTDKADLSGITDSPAKLGKVTHKVTIDVNEKGATAAASTGIDIVAESALIRDSAPVDFVADHPFLFVLSKEGHILFTGQYYS